MVGLVLVVVTLFDEFSVFEVADGQKEYPNPKYKHASNTNMEAKMMNSKRKTNKIRLMIQFIHWALILKKKEIIDYWYITVSIKLHQETR